MLPDTVKRPLRRLLGKMMLLYMVSRVLNAIVLTPCDYPLVVHAAQGKSGFVAVVQPFDPHMGRVGSESHQYKTHTGNDVIVTPSASAQQRLSNQVCVFVDDIQCKVAFVDLSVPGAAQDRRRWAVLDTSWIC